MKKGLFMMVLAVVIAGGVWAQSAPKNWISGDISLIGGGVSYERSLTPKFSIGGTAFFHFFFIALSSGIEVTGRFYPWAGVFYTGLGLGFGTNFILNGVMITPAVGWKIDLGKPGGFYINPEASLPIVLGKYSYDGGEFGWLALPRASFGMGYAF
jgi:hypothetical protein